MKINARVGIITLLVIGLMMVTVSTGFSAISMNVQVSVEREVKVPPKAQSNIRAITKDLILKSFKADVGKSSMVLAETKILSQVKGGFRCETRATFLYKKTYTAVMNLIRWNYVRGKATNIRTRKNYIPESEIKLQIKEGIKPSKQIKEKEKLIRAPKGKAPAEPAAATKARLKTGATQLRGGKVRTPWYKKAKGFANCPVGSSYKDAWNLTYYIAYVMHWKTHAAYYARGSAASVTNNMNVFKYGYQLRYYSNIGHGCPYGLVMSDGWILASMVAPPPYKWGVVGAVLFVNSCNAFKLPLRAAFYPGNWARVYISGKTPLYVGRSEWVDAWFWYYGLAKHKPANVALALGIAWTTSHKGYPGTFGITGYAPSSTF